MVGAGFLFALKNPASANQVILEKVEEYRRKVKCIKKEGEGGNGRNEIIVDTKDVLLSFFSVLGTI